MFNYDRIDVSGGIYVNKTSVKCVIVTISIF